MYVTADTLITAGAVLGAIVSFVTLFWKLFKWIDHQKEQDQKIAEIEAQHNKDISELKKHYADKIFETKISRNVKLTEAPGFGKPAYYHDKSSKGAKEYIEVAKELTTRI